MRSFLKLSLLLVAGFLASPPCFAQDDLKSAGDIGQAAIPGAAALITYLKGDSEGGWELLKAYGSTMATTYALKYTIESDRPGTGDRDHSFPSGHTASAFAGAAYLDRRYGHAYGIPAYLGAGVVGWSRVDAKEHHWSDVAAAAAIAYGFNYYFTTPYEQQVSIIPEVSDDGVRVAFHVLLP